LRSSLLFGELFCIKKSKKGREDMEQYIRKIINKYDNLFNENTLIEKLNVGFTNTVYTLDNKYILKICSNNENEEKFKKEIDFYIKNKDNGLIPKLYHYDDTKEEIPYFYEIIEKIDGVSLYNVWHLLTEEERKNVIKQLCDAMKFFHSNIGESFDWSNYITSEFITYYNKAKENNIFSKEEQKLIEESINYFKELLVSNEFVLVHNDLHFDNVFYKDGNIKLIDFERSIIAPKDFELDILYRMIRMPWRYASEEIEPLTKVEDYSNIMKYIEEFYPELINTSNLYKRLGIYDMLYFIKSYLKYPEESELKEPIIEGAKLVLKDRR
jgi:serine/threonine protein kinase